MALMAATILYGDLSATSATARPEGDALWLTSGDLVTATRWEIKPEGVCRDDMCIPVPEDRAASMLREQDGATWFNLAEFARYIEQPYAHDEAQGTWYFGAGPGERRSALESLQAPDFELQDLEGRSHRLSAHRGKKVALALWASW
jgi:hypothetical protein